MTTLVRALWSADPPVCKGSRVSSSLGPVGGGWEACPMTVTSDPSSGSVMDPALDPVPWTSGCWTRRRCWTRWWRIGGPRSSAKRGSCCWRCTTWTSTRHTAASGGVARRGGAVAGQPGSTLDRRRWSVVGRGGHARGGGVRGRGAGRSARRSLRCRARPGRGESGVVLRTLRDMVHEARLRMDRDHEQAFEEQALARRGVWFDHQTSTASAATAR